MFGYIYLTTNLVNGKQYIGQKKSDVFLGEKYLGSGTALTKAVEKYGRENFSVEMLESCDSFEQLNDCEKYWIIKFDAVNSDKFYNIIYGGILTKGSKNPIGESQPMLGQKHSVETKEKISQSRKNTFAINNGKISKFIEKDKPIPDGWQLGMIKNVPKSIESKIKQSEQISNRVFMHNQDKTILIKKDLINHYLSLGYVMGKHPTVAYSGEKAPFYGKQHDQNFKNFISKNTKGRVWMNNGEKSVRVKEGELEKYYSLGYEKGRLKSQ